MKSKGQAWGFDLIIAGIIFLSAIAVFYIYSFNYPKEGQNIVESLNYEGNLIADSLLTEGYPQGWTETNVVRIGISDNGRINNTKLEKLYNLANTSDYPGGYEQTKGLFGTKYDYFFNLSVQMKINGTNVLGVGKQLSDPDSILKVTRFTIYNNKPTTLYVYIGK